MRRRHFTAVPSTSASVVLLDTVRDQVGPDPRCWNLVSGRDASGNQIYGVSYSETALVCWFNSYEQALRLFEECQRDRTTYADYIDECEMRLESDLDSDLASWLREEIQWATDMLREENTPVVLNPSCPSR